MRADEPAFPSQFDDVDVRGLTIREEFAGRAMQGLLAAGSLREAASLASVVMPCGTLEEGQKIVNVALTGIAFQAATAADALIAALHATPKPKGDA